LISAVQPMLVAVPFGLASLVAYALWRAGLRLGQTTAEQRLDEPAIPPVLYLRSFDEDQLRFTTRIVSAGSVEKLVPLRRPRFEEFLALTINAMAPLHAISAGNGRAPIAVAPITASDETWQHVVRTVVDNSLFVLMSATPRAVGEGFAWEIEQLGALSGDSLRLVLVVGPWPRAERQRRLSEFLAVAVTHRAFAGLAEIDVPESTHVLTRDDRGKWTAYGANRRDELSYYAILLTAAGEMRESCLRSMGVDPLSDRSMLASFAYGHADDVPFWVRIPARIVVRAPRLRAWLESKLDGPSRRKEK